MACDSNRDANFSDSGKISATKWANIIAAQQFTVPEWRVLASVLVLPLRL